MDSEIFTIVFDNGRGDNFMKLGIYGLGAMGKSLFSIIYSKADSEERENFVLVDDVVEAVHNGRSPVLLTERREHLTYFADTLADKVKNIIVLSGGMGRKQRILLMDQLKNIPEDEERLIIATGRYLGEGFDDARLDTLFLALPIAWRGTVAQYAGRLHRNYDRKSEVIIYDYVDDQVPVLAGCLERGKRGIRPSAMKCKLVKYFRIF